MIPAHRAQQRHDAIADIGAFCAAAVETARARIGIDWARRIAVEARPRHRPDEQGREWRQPARPCRDDGGR